MMLGLWVCLYRRKTLDVLFGIKYILDGLISNYEN